MNKEFNDWLDEVEGKKQSTYDYIKKLIEKEKEKE